MTDWTSALFRDMHLVPVGQQKSDGKPEPHCCRFDFPPQMGAWRRKMWDACADAARKSMDILERRGRPDEGIMVMLSLEDQICVIDVLRPNAILYFRPTRTGRVCKGSL
jgi:hypothetical protein